MNLYEINSKLESAFMACIDPETGEVIGDTAELDALQIQRDEKVENIACLIKNLKAEAEAIQNEERKLKSRRQACENHADWLKKYLANNGRDVAFAHSMAIYVRDTNHEIRKARSYPKMVFT